jgi:hypothetical protein
MIDKGHRGMTSCESDSDLILSGGQNQKTLIADP